MAGSYEDRGLAWQGDVHVGINPVVASPAGVSVQSDHVAIHRDLRFAAGIPPVRILLIFGADAFPHRHMNLVVLRCRHIDRSVIVGDLQAGAGGKVLRQLIVIAVSVAEEWEIVVPHIHVIAQLFQSKRAA